MRIAQPAALLGINTKRVRVKFFKGKLTQRGGGTNPKFPPKTRKIRFFAFLITNIL